MPGVLLEAKFRSDTDAKGRRCENSQEDSLCDQSAVSAGDFEDHQPTQMVGWTELSEEQVPRHDLAHAS